MDRISSIRMATPDDAAAVAEIQSYYVLTGSVILRTDVPTEAEFRKKISDTLESYPFLVAEMKGQVVGFAHAFRYRLYQGYDWMTESTIYIAPEHRERGFGRAIYTKLAEILRKQNCNTMSACISCDDGDSEFAPNESMRFHSKMGFVQTAFFKQCAWKMGSWHSVVWMTKTLAARETPPREFIPLPQLGEISFI